jgi:hypothetical protein
MATLRVPSGPFPGFLKDSSVYLNTADSDQFYPKAPCYDLSSYNYSNYRRKALFCKIVDILDEGS